MHDRQDETHLDAQRQQPKEEMFKCLWSRENRKILVPVDEWFTLEVFFKPGDQNTGRVWIAITREDGQRQVLFDVSNYTRHPDNPQPLRGWQFFKLYTSSKILDFMRQAGKPVAAYYDDLEYWSDFPLEFINQYL